MKNLVKGAIIAVLFTLGLASCDKDQSLANKLEGTWTVSNSDVYVDDVLQVDTSTSTSSSTLTYTFEDYDVTEDTYGEATKTTTTTDTTTMADFLYRITNDGGTVTWDWDADESTTEEQDISTITSSSAKEVIYEYTKTQGTEAWKYVITLTKN